MSVVFSIPIARPNAENTLLSKQEILVTLQPEMAHVPGVGAYLECLVAQIRAPNLRRLSITFFNQITFASPHLSHFVSLTERRPLKALTAKVIFERDAVSVTTDQRNMRQYIGRLTLRVVCKQFDWQIDCAAQICSVLMPALSGAEMFKLDFYGLTTAPKEWQNDYIDGITGFLVRSRSSPTSPNYGCYPVCRCSVTVSKMGTQKICFLRSWMPVKSLVVQYYRQTWKSTRCLAMLWTLRST
ncbi:hypothetical protein EDB85DRAFT_1391250 [Lactarius pseudohatsudake]|nr:hypothetical protein EDB85DRAFT_1391250 [Lactarius pseudohatsudake]